MKELEKVLFITQCTLSQKSAPTTSLGRLNYGHQMAFFSVQLQNKPISKNKKNEKVNKNNELAKNNKPAFIFIKTKKNCTFI